MENDAVAAMASGTMGKLHGCVLIAGTGTIAYGFTNDGREARAAGAGPVLGDWGRLTSVLSFNRSILVKNQLLILISSCVAIYAVDMGFLHRH